MMTRFNPDIPATAADLLRNATAAHWHHTLRGAGGHYDDDARRDLMLLAAMFGYRLVPMADAPPVHSDVILAAPRMRAPVLEDFSAGAGE